MSIWVVVLLLGVVAMVVGPVMLLQPSPQDRRQAELRTRARGLGLVVRLESLPAQTTDLEEPQRQPLYCLPARPADKRGGKESWQLVRAAYNHESHFLGDWRWQGRGRPGTRVTRRLEQCLPQLPESVLAVGSDSRGWYLVWTEEGGSAWLERLAQTLEALKRASQSAAPARESRSD